MIEDLMVYYEVFIQNIEKWFTLVWIQEALCYLQFSVTVLWIVAKLSTHLFKKTMMVIVCPRLMNGLNSTTVLFIQFESLQSAIGFGKSILTKNYP